FQFDQTICNKNQHRNVMAILPGTDSSLKDFILIEAHLDSRCESVCDTLCLAQGMEDNGSGVALVLELARVMSKNLYPRTLVFMLTIGEEQGLDGANAFAVYCKNNGLNLRAVLNNDVIGGVICGKTASDPGCPGENEVDSMNVRIFSAGANYSAHKGFARFCKLEFEEEMLPMMSIKTKVNIMNAEDRVGRGGDHIPFRQQGYTAIRFTSANEHGDASNGAGYTDRQHTTRDVLGKDFNQDGKYDSLYVNTNYLLRNCYLNGISAATAAMGPAIPEFDLVNDGNGLSVIIKNPISPNNYRIGFRSRSNDFDTIFTLIGATDLKTYHVKKDSFYFVSVARQNEEGVESLFAIEKYVKVLGVPATGLNNNSYKEKTVQLLPVNPNPIDETLSLSIWTSLSQKKQVAQLLITDMQGNKVHETELVLDKEINEVLFIHGFQAKGIYHCTLIVNNQIVDTQKLLFK
ncbi:MAG: M28 family peptidase, partial [Bacteroidia bacterium]|nr:M28 family peptidase [Bacteroidia bacterium]